MADEPDNDDVLELTNEVDEQDDQDTSDETEIDDENDDEETVVTFGDEELPQAAPPGDNSALAKHLREEIRKRDKELVQLRRAVPVEKPVELGPKPTLAECDYDEDAFETERDAWEDRKAKARDAETQADARNRKQNEEWQGELKRYEDGKVALGFADAQDMEDAVTAQLDTIQQSTIVLAADNPALVLYSLGKHPAKLAELAKITNPVKLAAAIAKLEGALKVTKVRKAPAPDEVTRGSAGVSAGSDKTLERLEKAAEKSGDRTALINYKKKLKAK